MHDLWKGFQKKAHALGHFKMIHMEGLQFDYNFCDETYRSRKALKDHKNLKHK